MTFADSVRKFFYFSLNYKSNYHYWKDMWGESHCEYLPTFLIDIDWNCNLDHMIGKWKSICDRDSYGVINRFYADLDGENRKKFSEWIEKNYEC